GGYTGSSWLTTIVVWRPGQSAQVVARLPTPLRYAAVTAARGKIVVAGGSLPNGTASRVVYAFDPRTRVLSRLGELPSATTHAGAATLGDRALVIGGRSAEPNTPTGRIVAIDPGNGRIRVVGHLPHPLSDAAVTTLGRAIVVAGGRNRTTVGALTSLAATTAPARPARRAHSRRATPLTVNVYAHDGVNGLSPIV